MDRNKIDNENIKVISPIGITGYILEECFTNPNVLAIRHSKNRNKRHTLHLMIDDVKTLHHYVGNWLKERALKNMEEEQKLYYKYTEAAHWEREKRAELLERLEEEQRRSKDGR